MALRIDRLQKGSYLSSIDWLLVTSAVLLSLLGLVTMNSFLGESIFFGVVERRATSKE